MPTTTRHAAPTLGQLASRRFLILDPELPAEQARQLLASLRPEQVVVPLPGDGDRYAIEVADLIRLRLARADTSLGQALDVDRLEPVETRSPHDEVAGAPDLCLLIEDGAIVGVFDVARPNDGPLRGGLLRRYLTADHPPVVPVGELLSVVVALESVPWSRASRTEVELPNGAQVDVLLRCSPEVEVEGPWEASFRVTDEADPPPFRFRLRAFEPGTARVELSAFCGNACIGSLTVTPRVVPAGAEPLRLGTAAPRHGSVRLVPPPDERPDLSLLILETRTAGVPGLYFRLESEGLGAERRDFSIGPLTEPPSSYLSQLFEAFEGGEIAEDAETLRAMLQQRGAHLFETLLPPELRELLCTEQERISSVQILSDEYWIPWELCCLPAPPEGGAGARFFCEAFALGRWPRSQTPCSRLGGRGPIGLVVPNDPTLPKAAQEKQDLLSLATPPFAAEEIRPLYVPLIEALGSGRYGGLHFTGHGSIARDAGSGAEIDLEKMRFTPRDLSGTVANLRERRPFVFFNACQVGRHGQGLAGPDGWAAAFLRAGAGAFLGTYWSVSDEAARCFARHVYEKLFAGETIGEAVRHARCRVRDDFPESATWLAYTLYADPLAKLGSPQAGAERPAA